MEKEKVKLEELVKEIAVPALFEALGKVRPKYKGLTEREMALVLGLSDSQYTHLVDKALSNVFAEKLEENMLRHLQNGNSIEVPHAFNIFIHESEVSLNEKGLPAKKVSVRTRKALKEKLN